MNSSELGKVLEYIAWNAGVQVHSATMSEIRAMAPSMTAEDDDTIEEIVQRVEYLRGD